MIATALLAASWLFIQQDGMGRLLTLRTIPSKAMCAELKCVAESKLSCADAEIERQKLDAARKAAAEAEDRKQHAWEVANPKDAARCKSHPGMWFEGENCGPKTDLLRPSNMAVSISATQATVSTCTALPPEGEVTP